MRKFILTTAAFLVAAVACFSQAIYDIDTRVSLYRNGDALVRQVWNVDVESGTEWYIPIDNPGKSYIRDFRVYENGREYRNEGREWNSHRSLEEKTGRCGIIERGNGNIELCWGQGEYGDHIYTITYVIENLVQSYPECDGFHWHFLNDEWETKPQHVSIILQNESGSEPLFWESADSCNVQFWGFGMVGDSWLDDNAICFESTEAFRYQSFFSALVSFKKGLFEPKVQGTGTFAALQEEAMKGSDYGDDGGDWFGKIVVYLFLFILFILILIPVLAILKAVYNFFRRMYWKATKKLYKPEIFGESKIEGWCRDVPLDGNPTAFYSLLQQGKRMPENAADSFSNLVSAYFLKWIQDGLVAVEKDPKSEKRVNLRFTKADEEVEISDPIEQQVYKGALEAAGSNQLLEAKEYETWSERHYFQVTRWPMKAVTEGAGKWQPASEEERRHCVEFKNFLEDFTLVDEREAPEVGVWKNYLVLAGVLGIADKVAKNFQKLFPDVMERYASETNMWDMYTTYYILDSIRRSSASMVSSAVNRQHAAAAVAAPSPSAAVAAASAVATAADPDRKWLEGLDE